MRPYRPRRQCPCRRQSHLGRNSFRNCSPLPDSPAARHGPTELREELMEHSNRTPVLAPCERTPTNPTRPCNAVDTIGGRRSKIKRARLASSHYSTNPGGPRSMIGARREYPVILSSFERIGILGRFRLAFLPNRFVRAPRRTRRA